MVIAVTGGAGFIGSALTRRLVSTSSHEVVVIDKLTYAGNLAALAPVAESERFHFERTDICDAAGVRDIFSRYQPEAVVHLAAESHVDRSIDGPADFINTNVVGTFVMLEEARRICQERGVEFASSFRFLHVSTDEVFGSLGAEGFFTEETPYRPSSPYSASKAASDHLARAWHHTYRLPVVVTNCSNNYGPYQFPEKLIPLMIRKAVLRQTLPVYGKGENVRDWLFVDDHAAALAAVLERGRPGETYNIGGRCERKNLDVVLGICALVDELMADGGPPRSNLITYVTDRPGHDLRYAIDSGKVERELDWHPAETFETGLRKTVMWYLDNQFDKTESYGGERLGLGTAT